MKSLKDLKLVWDGWNKEHIKKHSVSTREVEKAFRAKEVVSQSYKGRLIIISKTDKGRLLTIALSFEKQKDGYVVSARDSGKKERKLYYENKTNKTI